MKVIHDEDLKVLKDELQALKDLTLLGVKKDLTMDDAALLAGLSKSHLYKLCCRKAIPYYKNGGKLTYFDKGELTEWLLQHRVKTNDELAAEAVSYVVNKTPKLRGSIRKSASHLSGNGRQEKFVLLKK
jgi:excisionase family DNA binding protein